MQNEAFKKISDLLAQSGNIAIAVAKDPNMDEMAAGLALFLALDALKKPVSIATPKDPLVEVSTLVGIDRVKKEFTGGGGDLTVSFPYREGEIEKVSYTLDGGALNIVVKAGEVGLSFDEKDVRYVRSMSAPSLLFVVGAPRISDLGKLFDPTLLKDTTVVNIDNKSDNQGFGDIVYVNPKSSSVSELVANLLLSINIPFDLDISQNLMSGISFATDNFQSPATTALAFEMVSILIKNGAQRGSSRAKLEVAEPLFSPKIIARDQAEQRETTKEDMDQETISLSGEGEKAEIMGTPPDDWLTPKIYKGSTNF